MGGLGLSQLQGFTCSDLRVFPLPEFTRHKTVNFCGTP